MADRSAVIRRGVAFDEQARACSLAAVATAMGLTIERVRCLEENALRKFRRQKVRDRMEQWAEAVRAEAARRQQPRYAMKGQLAFEFQPLFQMEPLEVIPGVPSYKTFRFVRAGRRTPRRLKRSVAEV